MVLLLDALVSVFGYFWDRTFWGNNGRSVKTECQGSTTGLGLRLGPRPRVCVQVNFLITSLVTSTYSTPNSYALGFLCFCVMCIACMLFFRGCSRTCCGTKFIGYIIALRLFLHVQIVYCEASYAIFLSFLLERLTNSNLLVDFLSL